MQCEPNKTSVWVSLGQSWSVLVNLGQSRSVLVSRDQIRLVWLSLASQRSNIEHSKIYLRMDEWMGWDLSQTTTTTRAPLAVLIKM